MFVLSVIITNQGTPCIPTNGKDLTPFDATNNMIRQIQDILHCSFRYSNRK